MQRVRGRLAVLVWFGFGFQCTREVGCGEVEVLSPERINYMSSVGGVGMIVGLWETEPGLPQKPETRFVVQPEKETRGLESARRVESEESGED